MKRVLICWVSLFFLGCVNSETPQIHYSDFGKWETVEMRQMGIGFEAPVDRHSEGSSVEPVLGRMTTSFRMHRMMPGPFTEYVTYKITIAIAVFSNSEWQRLLRGDHSLLNAGTYGSYEHKFCPYYLNHRKDVMSSDGRVVVTCAIVDTWSFDNRVHGEAQDEVAIRRIIESVHFLK
jgi:hypothetical protein